MSNIDHEPDAAAQLKRVAEAGMLPAIGVNLPDNLMDPMLLRPEDMLPFHLADLTVKNEPEKIETPNTHSVEEIRSQVRTQKEFTELPEQQGLWHLPSQRNSY